MYCLVFLAAFFNVVSKLAVSVSDEKEKYLFLFLPHLTFAKFMRKHFFVLVR